jgi:hypothetical protein
LSTVFLILRRIQRDIIVKSNIASYEVSAIFADFNEIYNFLYKLSKNSQI